MKLNVSASFDFCPHCGAEYSETKHPEPEFRHGSGHGVLEVWSGCERGSTMILAFSQDPVNRMEFLEHYL